MSLSGKTLFITGASRGIGLAIALRAARDGANIAVAAKTAAPHPKLPGTIYTAAEAIEAAGGRALPLIVDVREEESVRTAVARCAAEFGGIDICVNNASAINLAATEQIEMRRYDLIQQINTRGTFLTTRACLPHLKRAANPHVLTLSPPLNLAPHWLAPHLAYSLSKYGMSLCMLGMAEEYRAAGIACNALWPRTTIATAAVEFALGGTAMLRRSRRPEIVADAAHAILSRPARSCTGQFFIDDAVLYEAGVRDFGPYSVEAGGALIADLFIDRDLPAPPGVELQYLPVRPP
ncbi:MAG: NAD(P)-dependent oxidoreductase [Gammaproteobacteria bacterium]|nr:NAD(P)-dependent oxidoreductase [Gammaproteobacteria bacterium]MBV9697951.1 NAD(P)-dependent oxidoreductase [Gammaproteobacteria bacterium]